MAAEREDIAKISAESSTGALSTGARLGVTWRAVALSAVLAPVNIYWNFQLQCVTAVGNPTILSLYYNVVFTLVVLCVLNAGFRRAAPRWALSQAELLVVYILVSVGVSCAGCDYFHWLFPDIAGLHHRASPENRWEEVFFRWVPHSLTVTDKRTLQWMYEGGVRFFARPEAWRPWVGPSLWWFALLALMLAATSALAAPFRKRWIDVEKLTFPIVQLPFELTRERPTVLRERALWVAFGIVCFINFTNGMNMLKPVFPAIPIKAGWDPGGGKGFYISPMLTDAPWKAADHISLAFYPIIIGLGLLLPTELALSCWVFFLFFKGQQIGTSWLGLTIRPEFPYVKEQSLGGYLGIIVFSLWAGRAYYARLARQALSWRRDPEEPVSFGGATTLFAVGFVGLLAFSMHHGMGWWQSAFHWGYYMVLTLVCGRIRAEMGLPAHEIERLGPTVVLGNTFRTSLVGARSLTVASMFFGISRGMRSIPFPHQVEGLKLMDRCGGSQRRLWYAMCGMLAFATLAAWLLYLQVCYQYGAVAKMKEYSDWRTGETFGQLMNWLEQPNAGTQWQRVIPTLLGLVFYLVAMTLKMRVSWWPIHPIGFALSTTWYMHHMWCPLLIAWALKSLVIRYGGQGGVKRLAPIAYGLILGDTMSGCLWTIYGLAFRREVYGFWS